jgi:hypothetical protein
VSKIPTVFLIAVAIVVLILFGAGIWTAGFYTLWVKEAPQPDKMPAIVAYLVSAVNGILAANIGALLGVHATKPPNDPKTPTDVVQWVAAGWYLVMVVFAAYLWSGVRFAEKQGAVVPALPEVTKTGLGILIAVLAAVLGVQAGKRAGLTGGSNSVRRT